MDNITFLISEDLKKRFKIKTLQENTDMTKVLIDFIKKYVGE